MRNRIGHQLLTHTRKILDRFEPSQLRRRTNHGRRRFGWPHSVYPLLWSLPPHGEQLHGRCESGIYSMKYSLANQTLATSMESAFLVLCPYMCSSISCQRRVLTHTVSLRCWDIVFCQWSQWERLVSLLRLSEFFLLNVNAMAMAHARNQPLLGIHISHGINSLVHILSIRYICRRTPDVRAKITGRISNRAALWLLCSS